MIENNTATETGAQDELLTKAGFFWEDYGKKILIGLVVLIVVVGGFFAYRAFVSGPKETQASDAMFRAEEYFRADSLSAALNGDNVNPGFLKIISKYDGTKAANMAEFYAAACYLRMGDFANTVKYLKDFSTDSKQIQARATSMLGDAYSEQGKKAEGADQYAKAGKMFEKDDYNSPEYLFRAGYLYESLGKNKEAIEMYSLIKEKYARSERGFEIDKYLARLGVTDTDKK